MDYKIWKNPKEEKTLDQSQSPLWFWNDKLEESELKRQLQLQTQAGVTCTIPHARTNNGDGYLGGYLDEDWFQKTRTVLEYKREAQEPVWLYDEMDWPAGTCNKTLTLDENNRERYLSFQKIELKPGQRFRAQLTELHGEHVAGFTGAGDVSGFAFNIWLYDKETMQPYTLLDYVKFSYIGATVDFCPSKEAVAYVMTIHVDSYDGWGAGCANYLDDKVTRQFLDSTYEKYAEEFSEYFGSTIKFVFNDETRMANAFPWVTCFPEEFRRRKGYDILPRLIDLMMPGEESGRTRCDYYDVVASLYQEHYFKVLGDWCRAHGIGLYAHLLGEETLASQVRYSGDFMRQMRYLDVCGVDHLGKGIGSLNIKFASSAARSYGKALSAVEVFAGCGWELTFEEYLRMISWMFQQGMQIIINHGFFYSTRDTRKNDWPPSQFFQWQGWPRMSEANDMVRRLHYGLTGGIPETDILIYQPTESFWLDYIGDELYKHGYNEGPLVEGERARELDIQLQLFLNQLSCENLDFDLIHKDAVENFRVKNGKICNQLNGQEFSLLILPMCKVLPLPAMELAWEFCRAGGKIILLGDIPTYAMEPEQDEQLGELARQLMLSKDTEFFKLDQREIICSRIKGFLEPMRPVKCIVGEEENRNNHPCYENGLIDPYLHTGEDISGMRFVHYQKDGARNTYLVNYDAEPKYVELEVLSGTAVQVWDPFTGEIYEPRQELIGENKYHVRMELPCHYGVIMVSGLVNLYKK